MALFPPDMQSISIGGRKVPIALIGAGVALVGVIVVLRARKSGGQASIGAQPAGLPGFSGGFSPDFTAQLNNIEQELALMGQQSIAASAPAQPGGQVQQSGPTSTGLPPITFGVGPQGQDVRYQHGPIFFGPPALGTNAPIGSLQPIASLHPV